MTRWWDYLSSAGPGTFPEEGSLGLYFGCCISNCGTSLSLWHSCGLSSRRPTVRNQSGCRDFDTFTCNYVDKQCGTHKDLWGDRPVSPCRDATWDHRDSGKITSWRNRRLLQTQTAPFVKLAAYAKLMLTLKTLQPWWSSYERQKVFSDVTSPTWSRQSRVLIENQLMLQWCKVI